MVIIGEASMFVSMCSVYTYWYIWQSIYLSYLVNKSFDVDHRSAIRLIPSKRKSADRNRPMTTPALTAKAKRAIAKYGKEICLKAVRMTACGDGARTIGYDLKLTTNQADAAINAGQELVALGMHQ
jgi:hypothetical protein